MGMIEDINAQIKAAEEQLRAAGAVKKQNELNAAMDAAASNQHGAQLQYNPIDEATGGLKDQYKVQGGEGYMQAMLTKQAQEQANAQDAAAMQSQGALTNANAGLAMRGGLSGGTRAQLAKSNMRDSLMASQGVANQGMKSRNDIGIQGAQMNQAADQTNVQNTLAGIGGVNQFNLDKYKQGMSVYAANKSADATREASQNQGSWVCTESAKRNPLSDKELFSLLRLRRFALKNYRDLSNMYLYEYKTLVERMLAQGDDWAENNAFIKKVIELVDERRMPEAFKMYVHFIQAKVEIFWPECNHIEYMKLKGEN